MHRPGGNATTTMGPHGKSSLTTSLPPSSNLQGFSGLPISVQYTNGLPLARFDLFGLPPYAQNQLEHPTKVLQSYLRNNLRLTGFFNAPWIITDLGFIQAPVFLGTGPWDDLMSSGSRCIWNCESIDLAPTIPHVCVLLSL